jgi:ligand-binding SRPBCC domain-containing protein
MPTIILQTLIKAPIQACFDASRNIDMHMASVPKSSKEKAVGGVTSGLIGLNEQVEWKAKHLGFYFRMTVRITAFKSPILFVDEQIKGPFKKMRHLHYFVANGENTEMRDEFYFESPFRILGKLVNYLFLKKYMTHLLMERNRYMKEVLESIN